MPFPFGMPRLVAVVAAATSLVITTNACSAQFATETVPVATKTKTALVAISSLPSEISLAHDLVAKTCMAAAGYQLPFDSSAASFSRPTLLGVSGIFESEEQARSTGYQSTLGQASTPLEAFESSLTETELAQYNLEWWGDPAQMETITLSGGVTVSRSRTGCYAAADAEVYGSVTNGLKLENFVNEINTESARFSQNVTKNIKPQLRQYESCMSDAGYSVRGLNAAELAETRFGTYRTPGEPPTLEEQTMAVTDYRCQETAQLVTTLNELFFAEASAWIATNEANILGVQELLEQATKNAQAVLNGS